MIDHLIHADWSIRPEGRWVATARHDDSGWRVEAPRLVGALDVFHEDILAAGRSGTVLAGFDFPIGMPVACGVQTGFAGFRDALPHFGSSLGWEDFYQVAATETEIAITRPFYPAGQGAGTKQATLLKRLKLASADDLLRTCERGQPGRKRASPLFWTVGAAQVGRAAAVGWQAVVAPALQAGAALWPFDGSLETLVERGGLILAETYPADAYAQIGARFRAGESKRSQADRSSKAEAILLWARRWRANLDLCEDLLSDGFGSSRSGEDAFDALLGLLAMIDVADGRQPAMTAWDNVMTWEGSILGR